MNCFESLTYFPRVILAALLVLCFGTPTLASDPVDQEQEFTCVIDTVRWNTISKELCLTVTWSNTSKSVYLCRYDDFKSRFTFTDNNGNDIVMRQPTSFHHHIDVTQIASIHPGVKISREVCFRYEVFREESGDTFVSVDLGISGKAHLYTGKSYDVLQTCDTRCKSLNTSIVFSDVDNNNRNGIDGASFIKKHGQWVPRVTSRGKALTVPELEDLSVIDAPATWPRNRKLPDEITINGVCE